MFKFQSSLNSKVNSLPLPLRIIFSFESVVFMNFPLPCYIIVLTTILLLEQYLKWLNPFSPYYDKNLQYNPNHHVFYQPKDFSSNS